MAYETVFLNDLKDLGVKVFNDLTGCVKLSGKDSDVVLGQRLSKNINR